MYKMFGGKKYKMSSWAMSKRSAQAAAERLRKRLGLSSRISGVSKKMITDGKVPKCARYIIWSKKK